MFKVYIMKLTWQFHGWRQHCIKSKENLVQAHPQAGASIEHTQYFKIKYYSKHNLDYSTPQHNTYTHLISVQESVFINTHTHMHAHVCPHTHANMHMQADTNTQTNTQNKHKQEHKHTKQKHTNTNLYLQYKIIMFCLVEYFFLDI